MDNFKDNDLFKVLDEQATFQRIQASNPFISTFETDYLIKEYEQLYPRENGYLYLSVDRMGKLFDRLISNTMFKLVQDGLADYLYDDTIKDFVFKLKE